MEKALNELKLHRLQLTKQQYQTLYGQIIAGDADGAIRGLHKILDRRRFDSYQKQKYYH